MYGPILNSQRGKPPEEIDTTTKNHALSTHTNGSRSGMPLWGSHRSFNAPPQHLELIEGRISPVMRSDMTVSTAERTSSPGTVLEKDSFGYVELLSFLPSMQDHAVLVCHGPIEDQMVESEDHLNQTLMLSQHVAQPEAKSVLAMANYAILLHNYHGELNKAASMLEAALEADPTCVVALNAYGSVLLDVAHTMREDPISKREGDRIFDRGIKWNHRRSEKPNFYEALCKMQSKLKPIAMKGTIALGKRLHHLESIVAAEDLRAMGQEKFGGGGSSCSLLAEDVSRNHTKSRILGPGSAAIEPVLDPNATPITAARRSRHPLVKTETESQAEGRKMFAALERFEESLHAGSP